MTWLEGVILGLVQGLTEFLPISSSGHLEIGRALLGRSAEQGLTFTIAVHGATVLAVVVVFLKDILSLGRGLALRLLLSMLPVLVMGLLFRDWVEGFFRGDLALVGIFMLLTAALLATAHFLKPGRREISVADALVLGAAQAAAILPGLSRSGAVISTGIFLGLRREELARFAFLMSVVPIAGANILEAARGGFVSASVGLGPLLAGSAAAFLAGWLACRWMISLVQKGRLLGFALYCLAAGLLAVLLT